MSGGASPPAVRSWAYPDCPDCESDVFVDAVNLDHGRFRCQSCGTAFTVSGWSA